MQHCPWPLFSWPLFGQLNTLLSWLLASPFDKVPAGIGHWTQQERPTEVNEIDMVTSDDVPIGVTNQEVVSERFPLNDAARFG